MVPRVEKISAVTFRVTNMQVSVRFYRDVLGMKLIYGGEHSYFSSLQSEKPRLRSSIWNKVILESVGVD